MALVRSHCSRVTRGKFPATSPLALHFMLDLVGSSLIKAGGHIVECFPKRSAVFTKPTTDSALCVLFLNL